MLKPVEIRDDALPETFLAPQESPIRIVIAEVETHGHTTM